MAQQRSLGNDIKPLRNVAALATLIERVEGRQTYLPGMACFYGPSGFGKTFAAVYAQRSLRAVHVECREFWTRKSLANAILVELGIKPKGSVPALFDMMVESLGRSGRPLIVDEADHLLKNKMIELIRNLHDSTSSTVILVGEETLPQNLKGIERVHGRMFDWVQAEAADLEDATLLAPMYARDVEIGHDLIAAIHTASRGSIRRISVNLGRAREIAKTRGLKAMHLEQWGEEEFFTGEPPIVRRGLA